MVTEEKRTCANMVIVILVVPATMPVNPVASTVATVDGTEAVVALKGLAESATTVNVLKTFPVGSVKVRVEFFYALIGAE